MRSTAVFVTLWGLAAFAQVAPATTEGAAPATATEVRAPPDAGADMPAPAEAVVASPPPEAPAPATAMPGPSAPAPAPANRPADVDRKPTLITFDVEAKGVSELEAEAASQAVTKGLRDLDVFEVISAADVRQLLAIERTRQLLGTEVQAGSFGDLSRVFGARHAIAGTMTRTGDQMRVEIRLLDSQEHKVVGQKVLGPVTRIEQVATQLPGLAQELVGPLLEAQRGQLLVRCNEEAVEVLVDDVLVATTPMRAPVKLPRGMHRVQVRKDGFIAQVRPARILPEQIATEEFVVIPSPDYAEAYALRHGRLRLGAFITAGAAVALFGGAYLLDRLGSEPLYARDFLPRQLALGNVVDLPPSVQNDPELLARYQACGANVPLCQIDAEKFRTQLMVDQALTATMVVLGIASTGTAGYLFFTGKDPNRYTRLVALVAPAPGGGGLVLAGIF